MVTSTFAHRPVAPVPRLVVYIDPKLLLQSDARVEHATPVVSDPHFFVVIKCYKDRVRLLLLSSKDRFERNMFISPGDRMGHPKFRTEECYAVPQILDINVRDWPLATSKDLSNHSCRNYLTKGGFATVKRLVQVSREDGVLDTVTYLNSTHGIRVT